MCVVTEDAHGKEVVQCTPAEQYQSRPGPVATTIPHDPDEVGRKAVIGCTPFKIRMTANIPEEAAVVIDDVSVDGELGTSDLDTAICEGKLPDVFEKHPTTVVSPTTDGKKGGDGTPGYPSDITTELTPKREPMICTFPVSSTTSI